MLSCSPFKSRREEQANPSWQRLAMKSPRLDIHIHGEKSAYTTLDKVEGSVSIVSPHDLALDNVDISLTGRMKTYVDLFSPVPGQHGVETSHRFLHLEQPDPQEHYLESGILLAKQTYTFPFDFVIPRRLLPQACNHRVGGDHVRDAHLQLPPTLGHKSVNNTGDMSSDVLSIRYCITAEMTGRYWQPGVIAERPFATTASKDIVVVPTSTLCPDTTLHAPAYRAYVEKTIRTTGWAGASGMLTAQIISPTAIDVALPDHGSESMDKSVSTRVLLHHKSTSASNPPKLQSLIGKLQIYTIYASTVREEIPRDSDVLYDASRKIHRQNLVLFTRNIKNAVWSPRPAVDHKDLDKQATDLVWTTELLVPIALPNTNTFAPSFHSCLVSRIYFLKLHLSYGKQALARRTIKLKVPVTLCVQAKNGGSTGLFSPEVDAAQESYRYDVAGQSAAGSECRSDTDCDSEDDDESSPWSAGLARPAALPAYTNL